jgi:hypothetical protein
MAAMHACSQDRHLAAQTLQCSCCPACFSHSSAQTRQASAHVSIIVRRTSWLDPALREASAPVALQTSAQSRFSRMHCLSCATPSSATQASAHDVHVCAQSKHASMHVINGSLTLPFTSGWAEIISRACMPASSLLLPICGLSPTNCTLGNKFRRAAMDVAGRTVFSCAPK